MFAENRHYGLLALALPFSTQIPVRVRHGWQLRAGRA